MLVVLDPRLAAVQVLNIHLVLTTELLELLVEVFLDERRDVLGRLRGDEADAELAAYLGGDDRLRANAVKGTLDAVQGERRRAHAAHQHLRLVATQGDGGTSGSLDVLDRVIELLVECPMPVVS